MLKSFRPELRSAARNFLRLLCLLLLALTALPNNSRPAFSDEPPFVPAESLSESEEAYFKELEKSADEISVRELNECHRALLARMMRPSDWKLGLHLQNQGIIHVKGHSVNTGDKISLRFVKRLNNESEQDIGQPLAWTVSNEKSPFVTFAMSITVRQTDFTVAEIPLEKRTLYVNVDFVHENQKITKKRDDLGGVSVLEFVKRVQKGTSEQEKPE